mmetsp:Transcript_26509/g.62171  ORF Transcript_26509/g.62171 Transcript_26509/m.62171 type:complete len:234 (-) Transcript_26509:623-1324(-)
MAQRDVAAQLHHQLAASTGRPNRSVVLATVLRRDEGLQQGDPHAELSFSRVRQLAAQQLGGAGLLFVDVFLTDLDHFAHGLHVNLCLLADRCVGRVRVRLDEPHDALQHGLPLGHHTGRHEAAGRMLEGLDQRKRGRGYPRAKEVAVRRGHHHRRDLEQKVFVAKADHTGGGVVGGAVDADEPNGALLLRALGLARHSTDTPLGHHNLALHRVHRDIVGAAEQSVAAGEDDRS